MKEQLITFETAKLAKEKGFDEPCPAGYEDNGVVWYPAGNKCASTTQRLYKTQNYYTLAPTQALLQKWLREKYSIMVIVQFFVEDEDVVDYMVSVSEPETWNNCDVFVKHGLSVYENALEIGLQQALVTLPTPSPSDHK